MYSLRIHVLNVGHGDSIILELPDNNWGLVDCFKTNADSETPALTFLKARNVKRLKFVCLTHPHYDHFHGMLEILKHFTSEGRQIEEFWDYGLDKDKMRVFLKRCGSEKEFTELQHLYDFIMERVRNKKIEYVEAKARVKCLQLKNIRISSLAPLGRDSMRYVSSWAKDTTIDENLLSVVLVVTCGETNVALGGDTKSWEGVLNLWRKECGASERRKRSFDFIKVSHHGSRDGNHKGLWNSFTVKKRSVAVISTGCRYATPHAETVKSITSRRVKLYSTNFRDFSKRVPEDRLDEFARKGLISQSLLDALVDSTLSLQDFQVIAPYHGSCTVTVQDNCECSVVPEYNRPSIS